MPGSAQPERNAKLSPDDTGAGPTLATAGFGASKLAETQDDRSNGNSSSNSEHPSGDTRGVPADQSSRRRVLEEGELTSTLQLLVERAQYITGATGTALALPQGEEMVCRASAGASAPAVGARLQVKSGLTGESISRRQLLRCDNAEADPRVNLEACRALGIASIVVLPLLRKDGKVRGLFELFSDHPYAFEERDLIALERMAALTLTALDLAEQSHHLPSVSLDAHENRDQMAGQSIAAEIAKTTTPNSPVHSPQQENTTGAAQSDVADADKIVLAKADVRETDKVEIDLAAPKADVSPSLPVSGTKAVVPDGKNVSAGEHDKSREQDKSSSTTQFHVPEPLVVADLPPVLPSRDLDLRSLALDAENAGSADPLSGSTTVPTAMLRVQKCATCGFPVSEGRTLCLDCERKNSHHTNPTVKQAGNAGESLPRTSMASLSQPDEAASADKPTNSNTPESVSLNKTDVGAEKLSPTDTGIGAPAIDPQSSTISSETADEFVPAFLANSVPYRESWLSKNYVNVLAGIVLILCILVALVVFR